MKLIFFALFLDSLKAFGEKTADLFKTDLTPHQIEEKANQEMHDAALEEKRDSVLSQFVKVKDGLYVDKQLDQAQFQGDIQRVYPTGRVFTRVKY